MGYLRLTAAWLVAAAVVCPPALPADVGGGLVGPSAASAAAVIAAGAAAGVPSVDVTTSKSP
jgi:hypothetical protein